MGHNMVGVPPSILVNVPGEASTVVTCLDGFQMARQGRAGEALAISAVGSFIAGTFAVVIPMFAAPSLANLAFLFGPPEYTWLMVLSLTVVASFSGDSLVKGIICVALGALVAAIGLDPVSGLQRLTFGSTTLIGGFEVISIFMGLFGIAEMIDSIDEQRGATFTGKLGHWWPRGKELYRAMAAIARGTIIGFFPAYYLVSLVCLALSGPTISKNASQKHRKNSVMEPSRAWRHLKQPIMRLLRQGSYPSYVLVFQQRGLGR